MAYLEGYEHDVFLSYATLDDWPQAGSEGWVTAFRKRLATELWNSLGETVDVGRADGSGASRDASGIERAVRGSAVLVVLLSAAYARQVGERDIGWFCDQLRQRASRLGRRRILLALVNNLPREEWPADCCAAEPVELCETTLAAYGEPHARDSAEFAAAVQQLAGRLAELFEALGGEQPDDDPATAREKFTVFLAATADGRDYRRLKKGLDKKGVDVISGVRGIYRLDDDEREKAVRDAMARADLSVHLLGPDPGLPLDDENAEVTLPLRQLEVGEESARSQLVLLSEALDMEDVEDEWYHEYITAFEEKDRRSQRLEIVRAGRHQMTDAVMEKLRRLRTEARSQLAKNRPPTAFIDIHSCDLAKAVDLIDYLDQQNISPVTIPDIKLEPGEGLKRFERNIRKAQMVIVFFGDVAKNWVTQRVTAIAKTVFGGNLETLMCIYVGPPRKLENEVPYRRNIHVMFNTEDFDRATVDPILGKL